ncbi:MAG: serine/threonine-protein kinase [Chthoniobacterales bacterium]
MERITFFERYRISVDDAGKPREITRNGSAVTYRAVDLQSGEPVALKVIPIPSVDSEAREQLQERARSAQHVEHENVARLLAFIPDKDDFVFVSELTLGETIADWVAAHGPLASDATLRVALQVVSALQAAAFHGLTHAAIEPSNVVIVPGASADGGWPAIKLMNLDSAGVPIVSPEQHTPLIGTAVAPQFAAPEQLRNGTVDFRSEIYSLGATMCFMLTGLAPLGATATGETGESKLPSGLRRQPRNVRELLLDMLRPNPEDRPQDPVAFAERIRLVLGMLERRRPSRRAKPTAPTAPVVMPFEYRRPPSFIRPIAIAAGIVALAAITTFLITQPIRAIWRRHHDVSQIGVPVGVPDAQASAAAVVQSTPAQPAATAPQVATANPEQPVQQAQPAATEPQVAETTTAAAPPSEPPAATAAAESPRVAENEKPAGDDRSDATLLAHDKSVASPAEGPAQPAAAQPAPPVESNAANIASTTSSNDEQPAPRPARIAKKIARTSEHRQTDLHTAPDREITNAPPMPRGTQRARFVGTTRDGQWIFEAPSGDAVLNLPNDDQDRRSSRRRRHHHRDEADGGQQGLPEQPAAPDVRRALPPDDD